MDSNDLLYLALIASLVIAFAVLSIAAIFGY